MFSFEYPWVLSLIIVISACLFFCKIKKRSIYFPQTQLLNSLIKSQKILLNLLKFLILTAVIIALASPIKTSDVLLDNTQGYEISLILDASGSMRGNKFSTAKKSVADFIDKRKTDKLALSIFADFAYIAVPLTYDKNSIKRLLKNIKVGVAGERQTALYDALFLSSSLYKNSQSKEKIAILLTDGVDNISSISVDDAISTAKKYQIKVYTIGIGRGGGRDFNPAILQQIATETGGKYFKANNLSKLKQIYDTINALEKSEIQIDKYIKKTYYFQYFLILAYLLSLLYFYRVKQ